MYVSVCECEHVTASAHGGENRLSSPLELAFEVTTCLAWVLNSGPVQAASALSL